MKLTAYTDYTLRTLMYLGVNRDRLVTIQDIADVHDISRNHLMKIVYQLSVAGIIETVRGRNGGMRLKKEPKNINIGKLIRTTETDFFMVECFDRINNKCILTPTCRLRGLLHEATDAYLEILDGATLEYLIGDDGDHSASSAAAQTVRFYPPRKKKTA